MLKSILKAIVSALRGAFRTLLSLPGQILGHILGIPPDLDIPDVAPMEEEVAAPELSRHELYANIASIVLGWSADSLIDDRPAPVPTDVPQDVQWWLPGLTRDECEILINQDRERISLHLQGISEIAGVRAVQSLTPEPWPASPKTEPADVVVVSRERSESPAPFRP